MALVDGALSRGMPIVPVRFAWALPDISHGRRFIWPYRLAPMKVFIGDAMAPSQLTGLTLSQRRDRVAAAMNDLFVPAPTAHRVSNIAAIERVRKVIEFSGMSETKAILIELFMTADGGRLSSEGARVRELLTEPSSWTGDAGEWARRFASYISDGGVTLYPFMRDIYGEHCGPQRDVACR
mgnify:CR=1 FL=1